MEVLQIFLHIMNFRGILTAWLSTLLTVNDV